MNESKYLNYLDELKMFPKYFDSMVNNPNRDNWNTLKANMNADEKEAKEVVNILKKYNVLNVRTVKDKEQLVWNENQFKKVFPISNYFNVNFVAGGIYEITLDSDLVSNETNKDILEEIDFIKQQKSSNSVSNEVSPFVVNEEKIEEEPLTVDEKILQENMNIFKMECNPFYQEAVKLGVELPDFESQISNNTKFIGMLSNPDYTLDTKLRDEALKTFDDEVYYPFSVRTAQSFGLGGGWHFLNPNDEDKIAKGNYLVTKARENGIFIDTSSDEFKNKVFVAEPYDMHTIRSSLSEDIYNKYVAVTFKNSRPVYDGMMVSSDGYLDYVESNFYNKRKEETEVDEENIVSENTKDDEKIFGNQKKNSKIFNLPTKPQDMPNPRFLWGKKTEQKILDWKYKTYNDKLAKEMKKAIKRDTTLSDELNIAKKNKAESCFRTFILTHFDEIEKAGGFKNYKFESMAELQGCYGMLDGEVRNSFNLMCETRNSSAVAILLEASPEFRDSFVDTVTGKDTNISSLAKNNVLELVNDKKVFLTMINYMDSNQLANVNLINSLKLENINELMLQMVRNSPSNWATQDVRSSYSSNLNSLIEIIYSNTKQGKQIDNNSLDTLVRIAKNGKFVSANGMESVDGITGNTKNLSNTLKKFNNSVIDKALVNSDSTTYMDFLYDERQDVKDLAWHKAYNVAISKRGSKEYDNYTFMFKNATDKSNYQDGKKPSYLEELYSAKLGINLENVSQSSNLAVLLAVNETIGANKDIKITDRKSCLINIINNVESAFEEVAQSKNAKYYQNQIISDWKNVNGDKEIPEDINNLANLLLDKSINAEELKKLKKQHTELLNSYKTSKDTESSSNMQIELKEANEKIKELENKKSKIGEAINDLYKDIEPKYQQDVSYKTLISNLYLQQGSNKITSDNITLEVKDFTNNGNEVTVFTKEDVYKKIWASNIDVVDDLIIDVINNAGEEEQSSKALNVLKNQSVMKRAIDEALNRINIQDEKQNDGYSSKKLLDAIIKADRGVSLTQFGNTNYLNQIAKAGYGLERLVKSDYEKVRLTVAQQPQFVDLYANSNDYLFQEKSPEVQKVMLKTLSGSKDVTVIKNIVDGLNKYQLNELQEEFAYNLNENIKNEPKEKKDRIIKLFNNSPENFETMVTHFEKKVNSSLQRETLQNQLANRINQITFSQIDDIKELGDVFNTEKYESKNKNTTKGIENSRLKLHQLYRDAVSRGDYEKALELVDKTIDVVNRKGNIQASYDEIITPKKNSNITEQVRANNIKLQEVIDSFTKELDENNVSYINQETWLKNHQGKTPKHYGQYLQQLKTESMKQNAQQGQNTGQQLDGQ